MDFFKVKYFLVNLLTNSGKRKVCPVFAKWYTFTR